MTIPVLPRCIAKVTSVRILILTTNRSYHLGRAKSIHQAIQRGIRKSQGRRQIPKTTTSSIVSREQKFQKNNELGWDSGPIFCNQELTRWRAGDLRELRSSLMKSLPGTTRLNTKDMDNRTVAKLKRISKRARLKKDSKNPPKIRKKSFKLSSKEDIELVELHYYTCSVMQSQLLKISPDAAVRSIKKTKLNYSGKYTSEKPKGSRTPYLDSSSLSKRDGSIGTERETRSRGVFNTQMPISIPYTTPASEFLYGTSVVESALKSHRIPRRKMYKLYIYYGEQRQDLARDSRIERLAQKRGIEVLRVDNDHIRIMDKMSAGRPHNGFVLEASPLPKLPVKSLGLLTTREGANGDKEDGFEVSLDFQSREEASINGRSNFVKISRNPTGRKPLVLLLDGIVDPGNLGGLIRTASFLGVSAVAISIRNTAPLTPVVLKASAGAIENMTLLSVYTQDDFITASKEAGWKVYAAVAPAEKSNPAMPASLSSDDLIAEDPLTNAPVILMLGSEGEGLRWSIRRKADADIYIDGFGQNSRLDSLNVNVAAGILCNSLLATRGNLNRMSTDVDGRSNSAVKKTVERDQKPTADAPVTHYKDQEHIF